MFSLDNKTNKHNNYPYISPCGKEMNYVKCDDTPIVFHDFKQLSEDNKYFFIYGGSLRVQLNPEAICVHATSGRLYHPVRCVIY